jgi:hypothetical protein
MANAIDYALMAGAAYRSNRDQKNRIPTPQNWSEVIGSYRNLSNASGFEAVSFTQGADLVISFAGTDFSQGIPMALFTGDFWQGNIPLITGAKKARGQVLQYDISNPKHKSKVSASNSQTT